MSDIEFADGLLVKLPRDGAPEYVIGSLSIKRQEFIAWLQAREGDWVNLEMKKAKSGKPYASVDNFKPKPRDERPNNPGRGASVEERTGGGGGDLYPDDQIPFVTNRGMY